MLFRSSVAVNIRDEQGAPLTQTTIDLAAHEHKSFLLPVSMPLTANKRGVVEWTAPDDGQIGVVAIRANADGRVSALPDLTK